MLFKLSNLNSNLALTLGYLNPAVNNSALVDSAIHLLNNRGQHVYYLIFFVISCVCLFVHIMCL